MIKKKMRFTKNTINENQSPISDNLNYAEKNNETLVRINFEISEELRNAFKSKAAKHGEKIKDVMKSLMIEYVRKNETE